MDYKEYLLNQSALNLQYIAQKMWPTNKNAKSYLSTKLNDKGRPWTDADNKAAEKAINELGMQLIKDAPNIDSMQITATKLVKTPIKKEPAKRFNLAEELSKLKKE